MSLHNKTLTYMIENLGLPLMAAVGCLQKKTSTAETDAETMAKMLTSSVDLGMAISGKMDIPSDANKAEALRFRLTALGANALSKRIAIKGKEPSNIDIDSLKATTDSLFVFAENFSVNDEGISYLEKLGLQEVVGKEFSELYMVEALLPVISVMDHKDRGLFPNIAERLINEAEDLAKQFSDKQSGGDGSEVFVRVLILKLLAETFATIYPDIIGNNQPIGEVWQEFDRQKALIVLLMDYLMTGQRTIAVAEGEGSQKSGSSSGGGVAPAAEAPAAPEAAAPPPPPPPPAQEENEAPAAAAAAEAPPVQEEKPEDKKEGGGTPLSFFKKE